MKLAAPYQMGLFVVAVSMVILRLLYLGLVFLLGYGVFYHATENVSILLQGNGGIKSRASPWNSSTGAHRCTYECGGILPS